MRMDLNAINQGFFRTRTVKVTEPYFINEGECYKWAFCAYCLYGLDLYSTKNHAFVKGPDDLYYDAECLNGTIDWRKLRVNKETIAYGNESEAVLLHEEEFLLDWGLNPSDLTPILASIKEIIRQELK